MKKSVGSASAFEGKAKRSASAMDGMATSSGRAGRGMTGMQKGAAFAAGAGVAVLGVALAKAVGKAADFEQQLSRLGTASKANGHQMGQFRQQALKAGADTKFSALEAAQAQTELAKGGLSVGKIMGGGLKAALSLAAAGEMDLAEAAQTTVNAMKQFSLDGDQAGHVADSLATAAGSTTGDVKDFAMALTQGGGAAKMAGASFDETIAGLMALADASIKNSDAGTSLKSFFLALSTPSKKAKGEMDELNLSLYDQQGALKPLPAIAGNLRSAFGKLTKEQFMSKAGTIAGSDAVRTLYALYKAGPQGIQGYLKAQKELGTADKMAAKNQDNLRGKIENLQGSIETAQIIVGTELLPGATKGAEELTVKLNEMAADGSLKQFGQDMGSVLSSAGSALPTVIDGIHLLGTAFKVFSFPLQVFRLFGVGIKLLQGDFAGAASGILGIASTIVEGVKFMVGALAAIPGPIGAPFRAAEKELEALSDKINGIRDGLERSQTQAKIDVIVSGTETAAAKIAKLRAIPDLPPLVQAILLRGDLTAAQKIRALRLLKLVPKVQTILASDASVKAKIAALRALKIPEKVAKVIANTSSAKVGVEAFKAILAGVPASKVARIAAPGATTAKFQVQLLKNEIDSLSGKTINLDVIPKLRPLPALAPRKERAAGRGRGGAEASLVGEGRGPEWIVDSNTGRAAKTTGPTFMALGPSDYVIPTEDRYRGRALGLMAALAGDLGVEGYKRGRGPKAKASKRRVPKKRDALKLPVEDVEKARDDQKSRVDNLIQAGREKNSKGHLTKSARKARSKLGFARRTLAQRRKEARSARHYANLIKEQEDLAELGRQDMDLGNKRGDDKLYRSGKRSRGTALGRLGQLLAAAQKHVPKGSAYWRALAKAIGQSDIDLIDTGKEKFDPKLDAPSFLTEAEQTRLDYLEAQGALAALTLPLGDDVVAARGLVAFREAVLGRVRDTGDNAFIAQAATDVKSARDTLAGLTTDNVSGDLQAQLDQANRRREVAEEDARLSRAAVAAFGSSGDIGQGGANARSAGVTINNNISTLHPGDPRTLDSIGKASSAGISLQGARVTPRQKVKV